MWYGFGQPVRAVFPLQPNLRALMYFRLPGSIHAFFCFRPLFRPALVNLLSFAEIEEEALLDSCGVTS